MIRSQTVHLSLNKMRRGWEGAEIATELRSIKIESTCGKISDLIAVYHWPGKLVYLFAIVFKESDHVLLT
jgi:hypothetical protein